MRITYVQSVWNWYLCFNTKIKSHRWKLFVIKDLLTFLSASILLSNPSCNFPMYGGKIIFFNLYDDDIFALVIWTIKMFNKIKTHSILSRWKFMIQLISKTVAMKSWILLYYHPWIWMVKTLWSIHAYYSLNLWMKRNTDERHKLLISPMTSVYAELEQSGALFFTKLL